MRMLATFEKSERLRHIGHLDILRAMQRALRRSGLPVAYSNGFNPHILLSFASALPVGAAGTCEVMEVAMAEETSPEEFLRRMNGALPPEMRLSGARSVDDRHPAVMSLVRAARYEIRFRDPADADAVGAVLPDYLARTEIITERKSKSGIKPCDIRPLIHDLRMSGGVLYAELALTETLSCKPVMLLKTLGESIGKEEIRALVVRTRLLGEDAGGRRVPVEEL
ncbi:MAG: TIGR03936 family radical SAM-associated protein [Clostridia bacterium]|nr:TIGR03936 family radical SAM-associated protein [Clostridia bacterium]